MTLVINDRRFHAKKQAINFDKNVIPPITDPLGKHWDQPSTERILIDDTHALMSTHNFQKLHEYSGTYPSGVYPGKMWKRYDGVHDMRFRRSGGIPEWLLCWYGLVQDTETGGINLKVCSNHHRKIILLDGDITKMESRG